MNTGEKTPEQLRAEAKAMLELADKMEQDKYGWLPEEGEQYYFVLSEGMLKSYPWSGDTFDNAIRKFTGVYRTESEAQEMANAIAEFVQSKRGGA